MLFVLRAWLLTWIAVLEDKGLRIGKRCSPDPQEVQSEAITKSTRQTTFRQTYSANRKVDSQGQGREVGEGISAVCAG